MPYMSTFKKVAWVNGNHCKFESLHKTYNKKIGCPSTGNTVDGGFLGLYIRSWNKVECSGKIYEPGHLYTFDMQSFIEYGVPESIKELAKQGGILYCLRHYDNDRLVIHGWILTDNNYREVARMHTGQNYKSDSVVDEFAKYVCADQTDCCPSGSLCSKCSDVPTI